MELSHLIAREEIGALVVAYNSLADRGRFDEALALFVPTATITTPFGEHRGIDEIRSMFETAADRSGSAMPGRGRPHVRHHTSTHQIDLVDDRHATGRCYFAVVTPIGLDHWGVYLDDYEKRHDRWQFASRVVRVDGQTPDSLFPPAV